MTPSPIRRRATAAASIAGLLAAPLAVVAAASPARAADPVDIQIIATNDFHGRLADRPNPPAQSIEIASVLSGAVKQLRTQNPHTVFSAAGDLIGASTFESFIAHDKPTIDALNEAGLEVSAAGNHEFDGGYHDLIDRVMAPEDPVTNPEGGAEWQYLAANVRKESDGSHALGPGSDRWIKDFGDVQVGFVGAVTEDLLTLVSPAAPGNDEIEVSDIVEEVNASAEVLRTEGADVVVLLVHEGAPNTSLASATNPANAFGQIVTGVSADIDAIVSGHTHLAYNHSVPVPEWQAEGRAVTERPVVSAGQYGANLNKLVFTVDPDPDGNPGTDDAEVVAKTQDILAMFGPDPDGSGPLATPPNYPVDGPTLDIVDDAFAEAEVLGAVTLGEIAAPFNRARLANGTTENRGGESTLGNLVAEVQRWATSTPEAGAAQIAFMNPGGLRADMLGNAAMGYPAELTYKQAAVVQPFANTLVNMQMTGAQIKAVLEQQWQPSGASRPFLRLGTSKGFAFTYDPARAVGNRITGMWLNGTPLGLATSYSVTANSFLASGGDNFAGFAAATGKRDTGKVDLQAMVDYLAANSPAQVDATQHAVGVSLPAGAPADYLPGDHVKFNLSSLAFSRPVDPKDATVTVALGGTTLGTFPVDNTIGTEQLDEYGVASVDVVIPAGTTAGAKVLVVTGTTTGTTVRVPVTVRSVVTPQPEPEPEPEPEPTKAATTIRTSTKPGKVVVRKTRARIVIRVVSDAGKPQGSVKVRVAGKVYRAKVVNGRAVVKLKRFKKPGRYKVRVNYLGTKRFEASKKVFKLRVRR